MQRVCVSSGHGLFGPETVTHFGSSYSQPNPEQEQTMQQKTYFASNGARINLPDGKTKFTAKMRELILAGRCKNEGHAIYLTANLEPEAYNEWSDNGSQFNQ